jgi:hypothetical protein
LAARRQKTRAHKKVSREPEAEKIVAGGALGANISTGADFYFIPKWPILSISLAFQTEPRFKDGRKPFDFGKSFN